MEKFSNATQIILAIAAALFSLACFLVGLKFKSERLSEDAKNMAAKIEQVITDLHAVVKQMGIQQAEQSALNKMLTTALESLVTKVEHLNDEVVETKFDLRLLKAIRGASSGTSSE